jgi:hypothetical protein
MIAAVRKIDTFSSAVDLARQRCFAGLVLDGFDVNGALAAENESRLLARAFDIANHASEKLWAERFARRICEIDRSPSSRLRLASLLAGVGQCGEALSLVASADSDEKFCRQTRAVLHAKAGHIDEAFEIFDSLPGRTDHHPAPIVLSTAQEMMEQCDLAQTMALVQRLAETYPEHVLIRSLNLRCHVHAGHFDRAQELANLPEHTLERAPTFERRAFVNAIAESLILYGWSNALVDFGCDRIKKDPTNWNLYVRTAVAARETAREKELAELIAAISLRAHNNAEALAVLCLWHFDENRSEEGMKLLHEIYPLSAPLYLEARLYASLHNGSRKEIDAAFEACERCGISFFGPTVAYGLNTYYHNCSAERLHECVVKLESLGCFASKNADFWQTYLRCLIALGEESKAEKIYMSLPLGLANGHALGPFRMFFDAVHGDHEKARAGWTKYIRATRHLCVNARSSYPRAIELNYVDSPGSVLLFVTLINAMDYIDWFLAHYRALSVDHFFVIDNGSTDGSTERLCKEKDVSVLSNRESFARAGFGVLWINHLLQRFGVNHWCFYVDSDEAFVFPGYGRGRTLRDLLSYCDQRGFCSIPAVDLDMYPEHLDASPEVNSFELSCFFDVDYVTIKSELPPYVMIEGGIRKRLIGLAPEMQKSPLIRMAPDVRYVSCNHCTTHLPIADISGALLHYKFVGNSRARIEQAALRGEHAGGAINYRRLGRAVASMSETQSLLSFESRRYDGPSSLEQHGLMKSSALWEAYRCSGSNLSPLFGTLVGECRP